MYMKFRVFSILHRTQFAVCIKLLAELENKFYFASIQLYIIQYIIVCNTYCAPAMNASASTKMVS